MPSGTFNNIIPRRAKNPISGIERRTNSREPTPSNRMRSLVPATCRCVKIGSLTVRVRVDCAVPGECRVLGGWSDRFGRDSPTSGYISWAQRETQKYGCPHKLGTGMGSLGLDCPAGAEGETRSPRRAGGRRRGHMPSAAAAAPQRSAARRQGRAAALCRPQASPSAAGGGALWPATTAGLGAAVGPFGSGEAVRSHHPLAGFIDGGGGS